MLKYLISVHINYMVKKSKKKYQKPQLIHMSNSQSGLGTCYSGSINTAGTCCDGSVNEGDNCWEGTFARSTCGSGDEH